MASGNGGSGPWNLREIELGALLAYVSSHAEDWGLTLDEAVADLVVAGLTAVYGSGVWAADANPDSLYGGVFLPRQIRERAELLADLDRARHPAMQALDELEES